MNRYISALAICSVLLTAVLVFSGCGYGVEPMVPLIAEPAPQEISDYMELSATEYTDDITDYVDYVNGYYTDCTREAEAETASANGAEPTIYEVSDCADEFVSEGENQSSATGMIVGDMYIDGIPVSLIFTEPFFSVLGEPLGNREYAFFFYYGFQMSAVGFHTHGVEATIDTLSIFNNKALRYGENRDLIDLSRVEIGGVVLSSFMTRADIIYVFGEPYFVSNYGTKLGYYILNPVRDHFITICFGFHNYNVPDIDGRYVRAMQVW